MKKQNTIIWKTVLQTTIVCCITIAVVVQSASSTTTLGSNISTDGSLTVSGNSILGDADADTLTVNGSTLSIPNSLNISSGQLYESEPFSYGGNKIVIVSPYATKDNVYKGQLHAHSTGSDGADTPTELETAYRDADYNFMAITDHNAATSDPTVSDILHINGVEETASGGHILNIGGTADISTTTSQDVVDYIVASDNIAFLSHPNRSNNLWTDEELAMMDGFLGISIYNNKAEVNNSEDKWDTLLTNHRKIFGIAADDCHDTSDVEFNGAWVQVFADSLTAGNITDSLKRGNFYSSRGPTLSISVSQKIISVTTDNSSTIEWIISGGTTTQSTSTATSDSYTIIGDEVYVRIRVTRDSDSKQAWSNPIYVYQMSNSEFKKGGLIRGNLYADEDTFVVDATNNKVGIGTSSPMAKLTLTGGGFLQTINSDPTLVSYVNDAASMLATEGLYISGKYAYVTSYTSKALTIIDITVPAAPTVAGSIIDETYLDGASWVHVAGKYAYVSAKASDCLSVIDISDPANPVIVGSLIDTNNLDTATHVFVAGRYAYVTAASNNALTIVDIASSTNPTVTGSVSDATQLDKPESVYVRGKYAYVAVEDGNALTIIDISDPANPSIAGNLTDASLGSPESVCVSGKYAYVAGEDGHVVSVINIASSTNPALVTNLIDSTYLYNPETVYAAGKYLYVVGHGSKTDESYTGDYITIVDISDPTNPSVVSSLAGTAGMEIPYAVSVSGKYAYVASQGSSSSSWAGSLAVIDIFGIDSPSASIGDLAADTIEVAENLQVSNMGYFDNGINVGQRGIFTDGSIISSATSSNSYFAGNLGIGTTSPATLTDFYTTATTTITIDSSDIERGSCLKLKDVDGGGYTYCYVIDGAMECSATSCE
ncbi:hypothetical protein ACFL23_01145 [Patescibacteria group bacterium]